MWDGCAGKLVATAMSGVPRHSGGTEAGKSVQRQNSDAPVLHGAPGFVSDSLERQAFACEVHLICSSACCANEGDRI